MSNLWLNLRIGEWHLSWSYDNWLPRWRHNCSFKRRGIKATPFIQLLELRRPWY